MRRTLGVVVLVVFGCTAPLAAPVPPVPPATATTAPAPAPTPTPWPTATPALTLHRAACTGSMEPTLSCLDGRWERAVRSPEDVAVGSIVAFPTATCWPRERHAPGMTQHRVIAIREGSDGPEYLTQGDSNPEPDCWMPLGAIKTVVVRIAHDLHPENAPLRQAVNLVAAAALEARAEYLDFIEAQCGHRDPTRCSLGGRDYDTAIWLMERANRTKADHDCWQAKAIHAEYPGHIPKGCGPASASAFAPRMPPSW